MMQWIVSPHVRKPASQGVGVGVEVEVDWVSSFLHLLSHDRRFQDEKT